ncbi:MAG: HAMP domain-containing sensor histidine kinase [Rhodospirillales bacterium]
MKFSRSDNFSVFVSILTAVFLALSVVSMINALATIRQLQAVNYDNSGLATVQLRMHFNLMMAELRAIEMAPDRMSADEARLRYDIVYERLRSLPQRPPYDEILTSRDLNDLSLMFDRIKGEVDLFDAAPDEGVEVLVGVYSRLWDLQDIMNQFSGRVVQQASDHRDEKRERIVQSTRFLVASTIGVVVTGALFAFLLWRSYRDLRRRNRDLELAKRDLEQASRAKSQFLAHMSHELRTPLNAISGFSDMIRRKAVGGDISDQYVDYAQHIYTSGDHLLAIINDVLDLSKVEAGHFEIDPQVLALRDEIVACLYVIDAPKQNNCRAINVTVADDCESITTDRRMLKQILINLLSNAAKYSPEGCTISVDARRLENGDICVSVTDDGIGIAPEDIPRVLEPFGQSRTNVQVSHQGTGLGLSISRTMMEQLGGSLTIESQLGQGTTVRLRFPPDR